MVTPSPNRYGRKPSRGVRPWILLPKVLCVGLYFGGLAAAMGVLLASGFDTLAPADPRRLWTVQLLSLLFRGLIVPALVATLILGMALLLQHPGVFLHLRWLVVKLLALAVLVPTAHLFLRSRLNGMRQAARQQVDSPDALQFFWGLLLVLLASAAVIILSRLKPRLGQNWAKTYAKVQSPR